MIFLRASKSVLAGVIVSVLAFSSVSYANTEYKVKSTDSLSGIVNKFYKDSKLSRHQIFIGLLAENPKAFRHGNINYLKNKQLLSIPSSGSLLVMEKEDANNLVKEHNNHAKKRKKTQLKPPFKGYEPKGISTENNQISDMQKQQMSTKQELDKLTSETEDLRMRLEKLNADKEAMDAELRQLDELIKK